MDLTEQQAKDLPGTRLLCSYPVIVARHFSHQFNSFMKFILNGEMVKFWTTFGGLSFSREALLTSTIWWVKDAPNIRTVKGKRATPEFIDKYIMCRVLVMRVQIETHSYPNMPKTKSNSDVDLISQRERVQLLT